MKLELARLGQANQVNDQSTDPTELIEHTDRDTNHSGQNITVRNSTNGSSVAIADFTGTPESL